VGRAVARPRKITLRLKSFIVTVVTCVDSSMREVGVNSCRRGGVLES
jgi:hypothetical protein